MIVLFGILHAENQVLKYYFIRNGTCMHAIEDVQGVNVIAQFNCIIQNLFLTIRFRYRTSKPILG